MSMRTWATATVQWQPARNGLKYGVHAWASARGRALPRRTGGPQIANIFAAGPPKAGSQWLKALFDHPLVRTRTGLLTLPQLDYADRTKPFPPRTFVPGLYVSYPAYQALSRPWEHRSVYVFRDPRDIIVSAYYSIRDTHRQIPHIADARRELRNLPLEEGLIRTITVMAPAIRDMATWVDATDSRVARLRLEDIDVNAPTAVARLLAHCDVELPETEMQTLLGDISRESLQARDLAQRRASRESHYRVHRQPHQELLGARHRRVLESTVPGVIEKLGYLP